jgi:MFS family permease
LKADTSPVRRQLAVILVSFAAFLAPFTQSIYIPILPELAGVFQTTNFLVNASISIFTAALAIMQLVYGPLGDRKGRKRVLQFGLILFTLASVGCYLSDSIYMFLFFRTLQGLGIAAGSVMAVTVIGDLLEGTKRLKAMGMYQTILSFGPVAGPLLGGMIAGNFHYSLIFIVIIGAGLLVLVASAVILRESRPPAAEIRAFSLRDFGPVLMNPVGSFMIFLGLVQYYTLYNFNIYLPVVLTERYGLSIEQKALAFLPLVLAIVTGSMMGSRLSGRIDPKTFLQLSGVLGIISLIVFLLSAEHFLSLLMLASGMYGFSLGVSFPTQTAWLTREFTENRATAVGVYNFFRFVGMTLGPIIGSVLHGVYLKFGFAAFFAALSLLYLNRRLQSDRQLQLDRRLQ